MYKHWMCGLNNWLVYMSPRMPFTMDLLHEALASMTIILLQKHRPMLLKIIYKFSKLKPPKFLLDQIHSRVKSGSNG